MLSVGQAVVKGVWWGAAFLSAGLGWRACPDYTDLDIAIAKSFMSI
jgi:hypothetical protein